MKLVTQLPLALVKQLVAMSSNPGARVLDPVLDTGTTLVATAELDRVELGIELFKKTAKIAEKRVRDAMLA